MGRRQHDPVGTPWTRSDPQAQARPRRGHRRIPAQQNRPLIGSWHAICKFYSKKGVTMQNQKDPVCGMSIDTKDKESSTYQGKTYYFCSEECKTKFDKQPTQFA